MNNLSFFSVLKSNIKCAFCQYKDCNVRYYPGRKKYYHYGGTRYVSDCKKDRAKRLNRKLP